MHRQTLLSDDGSDTIASHSFRVTHIGYQLARLAKADSSKVVLMCLFHDIEETRAGDQNWVNKRYVKVDHALISQEQLQGWMPDEEIVEIMDEYEQRESLESHLAKDADTLDQFLLLKEYAHTGNQEAKIWLSGDYNGKKDRLYTDIAKEMFDQIMESSPSQWRQHLWTAKRR